MPISNFQSCKHESPLNPDRGFTLIEILVILLIVTVMVGIAVPRLPAFVDTADFDLEARRLELLLNMARNEAVLDSVEYGFDLTDDGYEFLRYDDATESWRQQPSPYQPRKLPEELSLNLRISSSDFQLQGEGLPQVLILSSGETTPVRMILESRGDYRKELQTDGYTPFSWQSDED